MTMPEPLAHVQQYEQYEQDEQDGDNHLKQRNFSEAIKRYNLCVLPHVADPVFLNARPSIVRAAAVSALVGAALGPERPAPGCGSGAPGAAPGRSRSLGAAVSKSLAHAWRNVR